MVEQKSCSFCGTSIEPGTGRLFIRRDGYTFSFCSSKCYKNLVELKRTPRKVQWTTAYMKEKDIKKGADKHVKRASKPVAKKARAVRRKIRTKEPLGPAVADKAGDETDKQERGDQGHEGADIRDDKA